MATKQVSAIIRYHDHVFALNPLRRMRARRLEQYREIENHEWMGLIETRVKNREEKEREIDLALRNEGRTSRAARLLDYNRRAQAAGFPMHRPEQQDAGAYGTLELWIRRETHKLILDRTVGRTAGKRQVFAGFLRKIWVDPVGSKLIAGGITGLCVIAGGAIGLNLQRFHLLARRMMFNTFHQKEKRFGLKEIIQ